MSSSKIREIEKVNSIIKTVLTTIAIFLTGFIQTNITAATAKDRVLVLLVSGSVLLLLVEGGSKIIEHFIDSSNFLRRIILKENFFEGLWIDKTEVGTYAIISIKYEYGEYLVSGKSYNNYGELMGDWKSVSAWVSDEKLECYYEGNYYYKEDDFKGKNEFSFSSSDNSVPHWFTGSYYDLTNQFRKFKIIGERISKEQAKKLLTISNIPLFISEWAEKNKGLLTNRNTS